MQRIREFWNAFRNFAIVLSFILNFVLIIVLLFVVLLIFQIKNGIAEPLIDGLHSNFVGLNEANIRTNIDVVDTIPINFDLTVEETTVVTLQEDAILNDLPAFFSITGGGGTISGTVDITLPAGTPLTIDLSLLVPVQQDIPIDLDVPVDIALKDTLLSQPFDNLRELFEPFVRSLDNLPADWDEVRPFAIDALEGEVNLVRETNGSRNPWPGFEYTPTPFGTISDNSSATTTDTVPSGTPMPTATTDPLITPTATITPFGAQ